MVRALEWRNVPIGVMRGAVSPYRGRHRRRMLGVSIVMKGRGTSPRWHARRSPMQRPG